MILRWRRAGGCIAGDAWRRRAGIRRAGGRDHGPCLAGRPAGAGPGDPRRAAARTGARLQHRPDRGGDLVPQGLAGPGEGRPRLPVPRDRQPRGLHRGPDAGGVRYQHRPAGDAAPVRAAHRPGRSRGAARDAGPGAPGRGRVVIAAVALLGYAALLLTAGAAALARAPWADRAPRLAVAAWLALTSSAVVSVTLGGVALVVPTVRVSADLSALLTACVMALRANYAHPGGAAMAGAGAVLGLAVITRVAWCTAGTLARAGRARRRHRRGLALAGRHDSRLGTVLVDHHQAAAWCLPGSGRPVVLTTAAVAALDEVQLAAVLAHERAHQRGHHHLLVSLAGALAAAFPRVRAFRQGHEQVARLVELLADDAAAAPAPIGRARTAAGMLTIAALAAFPLVLLAGPAAAASGMNCCPQTIAAAQATARPGPCGTAPGC